MNEWGDHAEASVRRLLLTVITPLARTAIIHLLTSLRFIGLTVNGPGANQSGPFAVLKSPSRRVTAIRRLHYRSTSPLVQGFVKDFRAIFCKDRKPLKRFTQNLRTISCERLAAGRVDFILNDDQQVACRKRVQWSSAATALGGQVSRDRDHSSTAFSDPAIDLPFHFLHFGVDAFEEFDLLHDQGSPMNSISST